MGEDLAEFEERVSLRATLALMDMDRPDAGLPAAMRERPDESLAVWEKADGLSRLTRSLGLARAPLTMREAAEKDMEALKQELGYAESPRLERLLIEQIASTWLQVHLAEAANFAMGLDLPRAQTVTVLEKRLSGAHRRYLRSLETLARVRRLLRPDVLQVNIGAQQVNVAGEVGGGGEK